MDTGTTRLVFESFASAVRASNLSNDKRELLSLIFVMELSKRGMVETGQILNAVDFIKARSFKG